MLCPQPPLRICGYPPFSDERKDHSLKDQVGKAIYSFHSPYWDNISDNGGGAFFKLDTVWFIVRFSSLLSPPKAKNLIRGLLTVNPNLRLTVDQALEHPWMTVDPAVLKDVHQRVSRRTSSLESSSSSSSTLKRTDTTLPMEISGPKKRGRPAKEETAAAKKAKVSVEGDQQDNGLAGEKAAGKPTTGKGSGRKGGPGRGKKGPLNSILEEPQDQTAEKDETKDNEEGESQEVEIPERGRQGTKFVRPAAKKAKEAQATPAAEQEAPAQGTRRSARTKKAE